jgi:hypothetical protein
VGFLYGISGLEGGFGEFCQGEGLGFQGEIPDKISYKYRTMDNLFVESSELL